MGELMVFVEQFAEASIKPRASASASLAVPIDGALSKPPAWQALHAGPSSGVGAASLEASVPLAYAAGLVAGATRTAEPRAADRWLQNGLQRLGGTATVSEVPPSCTSGWNHT